jgi:hypothetical protein
MRGSQHSPAARQGRLAPAHPATARDIDGCCILGWVPAVAIASGAVDIQRDRAGGLLRVRRRDGLRPTGSVDCLLCCSAELSPGNAPEGCVGTIIKLNASVVISASDAAIPATADLPGSIATPRNPGVRRDQGYSGSGAYRLRPASSLPLLFRRYRANR